VDWTLENELIFYLLVPLAAWALAVRRPRRAPQEVSLLVLAVWMASAAYVLAVDQLPLFTDGSAIARYTIPAVVSLFCPGILVGIALTPAGRQSAGIPGAINAMLRRRELAAVAGLALVGASVLVSGLSTRITHPVVVDLRWQPAAAGFGLVLGLAVTSGARVHAVTRYLAPIGLISYGIYLWHTVVIHVVTSSGLVVSSSGWGRLAWPVNAVWVLALTSLPATVSWLWIERPALQWASRTTARRAERPAAAIAGP
jgi:peptidoglycan/LPS O-acetylase OafA/YrhL